MNEQLSNIVSHFQTQGTVNDIRPLGSGLINDTYKVTTAEPDEPDYVLQRINPKLSRRISAASWRNGARRMWSVRCCISCRPITERRIGTTVPAIGV